jgi:RNA polymerase sigma factor (sigma-70 family)
MRKKNVISRNDFEMLLDWLDENRDKAAQKYENIRQKLIRIFCGRGCFAAEELVDETFDRVTTKLPNIIENYTGDPALYFYGVANNIHHEWLRRQAKTKSLEFEDRITLPENQKSDVESDCLDTCLGELRVNQRELVINYYEKNKRAKIECRKKLAEELGISNAALQIRIHRIRESLRECVIGCLARKKN